MLKHLLKATALVSLLAAPAFSLGGGAGFHWGFDWTTTMDDVPKENLSFTMNLENSAIKPIFESLDTTVLTSLASQPLIYVSRENFERGAINFGGKAFINLRTLPLDIEASINFGAWRYDGAIHHIDPTATNDSLSAAGVGALTWLQDNGPVYASIPLNIQTITGKEFFGLNKTPYAKLHADLTIKKTFKPKVIGRFIQPCIGLGASIHFETPVLSQQLVESALSVDVSDLTPEDFTSTEALKKIMDEITESGKEPKMGMHVLVGTSVKPPLIPLGFYVDGKYNLVFNDDEYPTKTNGFLVNAGIMFKIGS